MDCRLKLLVDALAPDYAPVLIKSN